MELFVLKSIKKLWRKETSCPVTCSTRTCKTNCPATRSIRPKRQVAQRHATLIDERRIDYYTQLSHQKTSCPATCSTRKKNRLATRSIRACKTNYKQKINCLATCSNHKVLSSSNTEFLTKIFLLSNEYI